MGTLTFPQRVLYLADDAEIVRRQLAGEKLGLKDVPALRNDVSTDEITPVWTCLFSDHRIGDYVYLGYQCADGKDKAFPITKGSVRNGGFGITVAGLRRGKGSSREASPYAELAAGIRLVFARSFERIYRQNCQNLGLLTSTDFGLLERIERGEPVTLDDFTDGLDPLTEGIVRAGGLFAFNRMRMAGAIPTPVPETTPRPMTYAEKIIARSVVHHPGKDQVGAPFVQPGDALFVRPNWRFSYDFTSPLAANMLRDFMGPGVRVRQPESIVLFSDHLTFMDQAMPQSQRAMGLLDIVHNLRRTQEQFAQEQGIKLHGELPDRIGSEGISHSIMAERYTLPGQIVVGTDSHTPHSGALGALAFGVGTTDMANAWITLDLRLTAPATCLVYLSGKLRPGVSAKDLVLSLLRMPFFKTGQSVGKILEFAGPGIAALATDERATITNMAAELGAFTGVVPPDAETVRFLRERRGMDFNLEPWMHSDPDAVYEHRIEVDCGAVSPAVSRPGDPGNGIDIEALSEQVPINIAYGGSCTGGKREDMERYHEVLQWAETRGMRIPQHVRFYLQFGSADVRKWCESNGMIDTFRRADVQLVEPGCGACINAGPGSSTRAEDVTISAINRNFPGRSGPGAVWLASPATVAASAVAGRIVSFASLQRSAVSPGAGNMGARHD